MVYKELIWSDFKNFIDSRGIYPQEISIPDKYILMAADGFLFIECIIYKTSTADKTDYETNYQQNANKKNGNFKFNLQKELLVSGNMSSYYDQTISPIKYYNTSTSVSLTSDTIWTQLHSVSGSGKLIGAMFVGDDKKIEYRILVDGNAIFDFSGDFLENFSDDAVISSGIGDCFAADGGKKVYFRPSAGILYGTSLSFEARKNGKKIKHQLFTYTEDV